ncbi:polysaccharide pyruvyl transferase family protein [Metabacillus sp. KIGAM252]|uniref:Polysaccharide pyruvyl transferase family protein n=1 Tax=Metabacillus flavus TaxID=2823519 RepID=A0ABS5LAZ7_9BACI|nr:polysaccharide pyruvyl transferase family protein [Metabacillus flavus]MBS2967897.1 polysaccharide pyruvyl transferase family protein [Metabacillus flavus]
MKFVIHGYYGAGNIGDDAILENMIDSVSEAFPDAEFCVVSKGLFTAYRGDKCVKAVQVKSFSAVKEKIKQADAVIVGGGGILQDYSGWKPQSGTGLEAKGMNYYGQVVQAAHQYGKKIFFYGIGIGPFFTSKGKEYALSLLSKAERISVRDEVSLQFVKDHLTEKEVTLTPDPALNLKSISSAAAKNHLIKAKIPLNKKLVGVCLRPWRFKHKEQQQLIVRMARLCTMLAIREKAHLVLFPMSQYAGDKQIMRKLEKKLPKGSYTMLSGNQQPKVLKGILGEFSLMIGMRLHSLILSASQNVPVIGISYDPKVDHFMDSIGRKHHSFRYSAIKPDNLFAISKQLMNQPEAERHEMGQIISRLQDAEKRSSHLLIAGKGEEPAAVKKLRIAHFGRYGEGDTDIVRSMFLSLVQMGHEVQEWNTGIHPEWTYAPKKHGGGNGPIYVRLRIIREKLMKFRPDLIICNAGGLTFSRSDMDWLKNNGIPVLGISLSDPDVFPTVSQYADRFTWHATNAMLAYEKYKKQGSTNIYYMPFGIDSRFFEERPAYSKFAADVAIIGHGRRDRYPIASALCQNFNTKLYGVKWPYPGHAMGEVRGDDWFKAAYSTKMLVNFPRTVKGHTNIKVGILEAAATGKLLFTEYFEEMKNLFEYGEEIVAYHSKEDLIGKIKYFLEHPEEAERIGSNAKQRCLRDHTWEKRIEKLFSEIGIYAMKGSK